MAPQAGLEPATDRLTADSSTTELLWNKIILTTRFSITFLVSDVNVFSHLSTKGKQGQEIIYHVLPLYAISITRLSLGNK